LCGRRTTKSHRGPGSALVFKYFDFMQPPRVHVENETAHGDVFGNPGMRPDFLDLLPGVFLGVLVGEEAHWSRRRISGRSAQLRVHFVICECRESAAGVVEKQYLCASEYSVGNNKFPENIFCYRWSAGSDNVDIGLRQTQDSREVWEPWIHAGYNYDFGSRMLPQRWIVISCIVTVCF